MSVNRSKKVQTGNESDLKTISEGASLNLDRYVPGLLLWITNRMSASASKLYRKKYGIGVTQWRVLAFIELYPNSTGAQACQLMGIDKGAVSKSLRFLESEGWLTSSPSSGHRIKYSTTKAGRELYSRVLETASSREEALLTGFAEEERDLLIDFLHRLLENQATVDQIGDQEG